MYTHMYCFVRKEIVLIEAVSNVGLLKQECELNKLFVHVTSHSKAQTSFVLLCILFSLYLK